MTQRHSDNYPLTWPNVYELLEEALTFNEEAKTGSSKARANADINPTTFDKNCSENFCKLFDGWLEGAGAPATKRNPNIIRLMRQIDRITENDIRDIFKYLTKRGSAAKYQIKVISLEDLRVRFPKICLEKSNYKKLETPNAATKIDANELANELAKRA